MLRASRGCRGTQWGRSRSGKCRAQTVGSVLTVDIAVSPKCWFASEYAAAVRARSLAQVQQGKRQRSEPVPIGMDSDRDDDVCRCCW